MNQWAIFATGLAARLLAAVAEYYSDWLFSKLADGRDSVGNFLDDLRDFAAWLIAVVAGRCCGRPADYPLY
jgi:hypothetical protein